MEWENIGDRIKFFRERKKMTQYALAQQAGVSPTYIYQLERNEKSPTVEYLGHICWGLGISIKEFFDADVTVEQTDYVADLTPKQIELLNAFLNSLKS
ncbi:MAG: helix-turn-helix domain-containing protein [Clostridiales bacterium]|nr:helix-turn-helix domain-containing protein [Clostridiales bacterium]